MKPNVFADRKIRADRFAAKDAVIVPILRRIPMGDPRRFRAILMPALWGPELFVLPERGALMGNLFAIDHDPAIHRILANPRSKHTHLIGIRTTPRPMAVGRALDHAPFDDVSLVYLDFNGQPGISHLPALEKLFSPRLRLLRRGATVLLCFSRNSRATRFVAQVNRMLREPARTYLTAAIKRTGHRVPAMISAHSYTHANGMTFSVLEALF